MRRVPAREMTIAGVERVLAEHDVLTGDVLLVEASTIVVTDDAGVRGRPLRPVDPAALERQLLRRVVARRQVGDERHHLSRRRIHSDDPRSVVWPVVLVRRLV